MVNKEGTVTNAATECRKIPNFTQYKPPYFITNNDNLPTWPCLASAGEGSQLIGNVPNVRAFLRLAETPGSEAIPSGGLSGINLPTLDACSGWPTGVVGKPSMVLFSTSMVRGRCKGHIINLIVEAILYGEAISAFRREIVASSDDDSFRL